MILVATLNAEVDRIDRALAALNRRRFAALGRCDQITAKHLHTEIVSLNRCREELLYGEPLFKADE
jgi:hypothetical protein